MTNALRFPRSPRPRHQHHGRPTAALLLATLGLVAPACEDPRALPADAAGTVDAGPDATPALRALTQKRLFGGAPAENHFFDPQFASTDGTGWAPYGMTGAASRITRLHLPRTPAGQPVLRLERDDGSNAELFGVAKGVSTAMELTIWIGRNDADAGDFSFRSVVFGFAPGQGDGSFDVEADPDTAPVALDGITWQRFALRTTAGPLGFAYLYLKDSSGLPLYLTSPVLRPLTAKRAGHRPRPFTAEERAVVAAIRRRMSERFGPSRPQGTGPTASE